MGKIIRLTEKDLTKIVKSVIRENEQTTSGDTQQVDYSKYGGKKPVFTTKWGWEDEDGEWHDFPAKETEMEKESKKRKWDRIGKNEEIDKKIREPLKKHGKENDPQTIIIRALVLAKNGEENPGDLTKYLMTRFRDLKLNSWFGSSDDSRLSI